MGPTTGTAESGIFSERWRTAADAALGTEAAIVLLVMGAENKNFDARDLFTLSVPPRPVLSRR